MNILLQQYFKYLSSISITNIIGYNKFTEIFLKSTLITMKKMNESQSYHKNKMCK